MLTNENSWIRRQEVFFKKLTKSHEDILKIDHYYKKKKIDIFKFSIIKCLIERILKLFVLFLTLVIICFCYYFYVYVNIFL